MAEFHRLRGRKEIEEDNLYHHTSSTSTAASSWNELNAQAETRAKTATSTITAPMPSLDHLSLRDYDQVYEPAEDTYLLLDAIQYEFKKGTFDHYINNNNNNRKLVVLEIGCGTGVASVLFRSQWIERCHDLLDTSSSSKAASAVNMLESYVTDINPKAIQITLETDSRNNNGRAFFHQEEKDNNPNPIQAVQCDLATDLLTKLSGKVDVLIFNPPYVPTDDSEVVDIIPTRSSSPNTSTNNQQDEESKATNSNTSGTTTEDIISPSMIAGAWAGGKDGRRVVDRAIPQIKQLLRRPHKATGTGGALYLVTVDDNRPAQLASHLSSLSLEMKPLFRRRAHNEFLTIQKITWKQRIPPNDRPTATNES